MGQFTQTATFETKVGTVEVISASQQFVLVGVLDDQGNPTGKVYRLKYSIGDKGYLWPDGSFAFAASTTTDDAIKALYAAVQADVDANPQAFEWAK